MWKLPAEPVMPWQMTRVVLSTRMLIRVNPSGGAYESQSARYAASRLFDWYRWLRCPARARYAAEDEQGQPARKGGGRRHVRVISGIPPPTAARPSDDLQLGPRRVEPLQAEVGVQAVEGRIRGICSCPSEWLKPAPPTHHRLWRRLPATGSISVIAWRRSMNRSIAPDEYCCGAPSVRAGRPSASGSRSHRTSTAARGSGGVNGRWSSARDVASAEHLDRLTRRSSLEVAVDLGGIGRPFPTDRDHIDRDRTRWCSASETGVTER